MLIRAARTGDLPFLAGIEHEAGLAFADIGMVEVSDDEDPTVEELTPYQQDGRAWVAVDASDLPVAYLIAEEVDGCCHIEQVSVHPTFAGQRIGRALIEEAARWGLASGLRGLTLTTFTDVPWNGPYYLRLGFRILSDEEVTPGLRQIRKQEAARGLDAWPRVCMWRALEPES